MVYPIRVTLTSTVVFSPIIAHISGGGKVNPVKLTATGSTPIDVILGKDVPLGDVIYRSSPIAKWAPKNQIF
jgi:hypothetical protein